VAMSTVLVLAPVPEKRAAYLLAGGEDGGIQAGDVSTP